MKAIQTSYNGYLFRSRLEARWAVFFDSAGIEYQYEPEGFELIDGSYYLPDFYLPNIKGRSGPVYVEVKGIATEDDSRKIQLFTNMGTGPDYRQYGDYEGKPLYVVSTIPRDTNDCYDKAYQPIPGDGWIVPYNFETIDGDHYGAFFYKHKNGDIGIWGTDNIKDDEWYPGGFEWFDQHYAKARKARFEHGETPSAVDREA